jgi:NADH-quinone oxidoreductase subunit J
VKWIQEGFTGFLMPSFWLFLLPLLAGAAAIYLLLPRPRAYPVLWGAVLGVVALGLAGWLIVGFGTLTPESFLFYVFSATAIGFGGLLVTQRNPARAALSFALVVLSTCGLFLLLAAPFLMAATIIIYAGAIIVTFLFVLMLAQQEGPSDADARSREPMLATAVGFILLGALLYVLQLQLAAENGEEGRLLAQMLDKVAVTRDAVSEETIKDKTEYRKEVLSPLIDALSDADARMTAKPLPQDRERLARRQTLSEVQGKLEAVVNEWPETSTLTPDQAKADLSKLETALLQIKQQHGWPQPDLPAGRERVSNLSDFSGPQPDLRTDQVRADPDAGGRPYMPADNPAYLGRSLFTDYLLPVELGGFLLLVAAIGAIAIAQRQRGPSAPRLAGDQSGPSAPRLAGDQSGPSAPRLAGDQSGPSAPRLAGDSRSESPTLAQRTTPERS